MSEIRLFTDGACKANGKKGAQGSYAGYFPENKDWSFAERIPENESQTNQRGELKAIYEGVKIAIEKCGDPSQFTLKIYTDSTYSRDCLTTWLPGWMRNKWMTAAGKPVVHRDLIEETSMNLPKFKGFVIQYVKAHTGNQDELSRYNHIVDQMAVRVLSPEEAKAVVTKDQIYEDLPLSIMGSPLEESKVIEWCKTHLHELDPQALKVGLFSAFQKTVRKNGYETDIQVIQKTRFVRLVSKDLITESVVIVKEE
jgi:ribonuclease HI